MTDHDKWKCTEPPDTDPPPFGDWCQHCEGMGWIEDEDGKHTCPECNGRTCVEDDHQYDDEEQYQPDEEQLCDLEPHLRML